jgi:hypothetical protein
VGPDLAVAGGVALVVFQPPLDTQHRFGALHHAYPLVVVVSESPGPPLILVTCPAGFGKISLLAAWYLAEARRRAMAWLTVDMDDDPAVLWSYLLEAWRR